MSDEQFKTSDMALVTYLRMQGFEIDKVYWEGGTCLWAFHVQEGLATGISDFNEERATVAPKSYNRMYGVTKKEFFDSRPRDGRR